MSQCVPYTYCFKFEFCKFVKFLPDFELGGYIFESM